MVDSLHRDIKLLTNSGGVESLIINNMQDGTVFMNLLIRYRRMITEINITPDPNYSEHRMFYEGKRAGYDWNKAKEILERH